ncbi:uracil phosphoribosyltransferase [Lentimicrobium sp. L6]|nr:MULTISPECIES: uracil phosphoribosyltransferase [unclassified Lentimicrobium]NPD46582.1 uracil phosphoribosyltransferase [Lentimicrobium sp. S6]NPD85725.1 uracil phosphoribosyltransferase [Lentimicrobium sp. L6]
MVHNLSSEISILNQYVSELRNVKVQNDRWRFRKNLERIGAVMAYEISKQLEYEVNNIETPLGVAQCNQLKSNVVVASIMRAGIPMHNGLLSVFDHAENAFISAYRKHEKDGSFKIKLEYVSKPDLTDKILILCDPMLATGASMGLTYKALIEEAKPKHTHILSAIASSEGINYLERNFSKSAITIWSAAIDDELTAQSYIVPGLGDAGDLAFGKKL